MRSLWVSASRRHCLSYILCSYSSRVLDYRLHQRGWYSRNEMGVQESLRRGCDVSFSRASPQIVRILIVSFDTTHLSLLLCSHIVAAFDPSLKGGEYLDDCQIQPDVEPYAIDPVRLRSSQSITIIHGLTHYFAGCRKTRRNCGI